MSHALRFHEISGMSGALAPDMPLLCLAPVCGAVRHHGAPNHDAAARGVPAASTGGLGLRNVIFGQGVRAEQAESARDTKASSGTGSRG